MVAHVILVSAQSPNLSFFFFWETFIQLGGLLEQGLGLGFGPGLDKNCQTFSMAFVLFVDCFVLARVGFHLLLSLKLIESC